MKKHLFIALACLVSSCLTGGAFASAAPADADKKTHCRDWLKKERESSGGRATESGLDKTCSCMVKHITSGNDTDMENAWDACE